MFCLPCPSDPLLILFVAGAQAGVKTLSSVFFANREEVHMGCSQGLLQALCDSKLASCS